MVNRAAAADSCCASSHVSASDFRRRRMNALKRLGELWSTLATSGIKLPGGGYHEKAALTFLFCELVKQTRLPDPHVS